MTAWRMRNSHPAGNEFIIPQTSFRRLNFSLVHLPPGIDFARMNLWWIDRKIVQESIMADTQTKAPPRTDGQTTAPRISREQLISLLNEDLQREYQAIIAYVVYSQVLKGAQYMSIAGELEKHAAEELKHALIVAKQIDYLGGMPTVTPKPVRVSEKAEDMLWFDLENENETVRNYRERVRQCEALGEYAMAEHIRDILVNEQEHQIDLATALGKDVTEVTDPGERA
jgi:bacterioferritin